MKCPMTLVLLVGLIATAHAENRVREKLSELYQLRNEIRKAVFEKSRFRDELARLRIEMSKQSEGLESLEQDQTALKEKMLSRVKGLYKLHRLQPQGSVMQIFGSHNFLKKSFYLKYLNEQDKRLVGEYKRKTESIKKEREQYKRRVGYFKKMNRDIQKKHLSLLSQEKKQRELIQVIKRAVQSSKSAEDNKNFFSELRGKLKAPVNGPHRGQFGLRRDRRTDLTYLDTGIYFEASEGSDVQSIASGEVLYIGEIEGWGLTMVVDHGEFYYSIYSHLKNPSVRLGEKVLDHQKLAVVGRSAYDNNQSLYFEIRHFSEPQDPTEWIERGTL